MKYYAEVGGRTREVVIEEGGVIMDGARLQADISGLPGTDRHHLRLDGRSVPLFARRTREGWIVELEGRALLVQVEDERTRHIRALASVASPTVTGHELRAPMPGLIVTIEVELGQTVESGTGLVVMEAMKMENELRADGPGTVVAIEVEPGETVDRDQVLLRLA